jgi:hypothetical protein
MAGYIIFSLMQKGNSGLLVQKLGKDKDSKMAARGRKQKASLL